MEVVTDLFLHIVTYIRVKQIIKKEKKNCRAGIRSNPSVVSDRSECELAVDCKKEVGFKQAK